MTLAENPIEDVADSGAEEEPQILGGTVLPNVDPLSPRVAVALGQNPSMFTGPGTNTYLVGTGRKRFLLDTGSGHDEYMPVLEEAIARVGCTSIEAIVLTHAHPDHIGGVNQVRAHFGNMPVYKLPWPVDSEAASRGDAPPPTVPPHPDALDDAPIELLEDGDVIDIEGATLRAIFTPGHAPDHLCFWIEEEQNLFSGDNVLGVGTTVIPAESGSLSDYMKSLERILEESPNQIYPAHGPRIECGVEKIREYFDHRLAREQQVLEALQAGDRQATAIVKRIYFDYPESLHAAAAQSVTSHLQKLETEGRVRSEHRDEAPTTWWRVDS